MWRKNIVQRYNIGKGLVHSIGADTASLLTFNTIKLSSSPIHNTCLSDPSTEYGTTMGPWVHMGACGCMWVHMGARGCMWVHVGACGCTWVHVGARGCTWVHMGACGCTWVHMGAEYGIRIRNTEYGMPPKVPPVQNTEYGYGIRNTECHPKWLKYPRYGIRIRNTEYVMPPTVLNIHQIQNTDTQYAIR